MPTLPRSTTSVEQNAGGAGAVAEYLAVIAPVAVSADAVPRQFGSGASVEEQHGYGPAVEFAALYTEETQKPLIVVGVPITTAGAISGDDDTGNSGTSVVTVAEGGSGTLFKHDGVVRVVTGGTIGTDLIVIELSLDGGYSFRRIRLGTANSYAIPRVGATISFAAGTLVAGDTILTWSATGPQLDSAGLTSARTALANQQKKTPQILVLGEASANAFVTAVAAQVNAFASANDRFAFARVQLRDQDFASEETKAEWIADLESTFTLDDEFRVSLGAGYARKFSSYSGYHYRMPVTWAAAIRNGQKDLHIPAFRKADGALSGWTLENADGELVEFDDRIDGGAGLAARFTTFRTYANGPLGTYLALDLTREQDGTVLSYVHNVRVTNLAQSVVQSEGEMLIGQVLELNEDGTATPESLSVIQRRVQSALDRTVSINVGDGKRSSSATWTPNADDVLSGAEALLTGVLRLNLNGTIHSVSTQIRVQ